jgi:uncharacterized protein
VSKGGVIVDTGPLVALLAADEAHHVWVRERLKELNAPFITCEAVLAETFFLVSKLPNGKRGFFDLLATGVLTSDFHLLDHQETLRKLILKYADLPMSLADACLVRMAELNPGSTVFTLDSHFRLYRKNGRQHIPTIMP